MGRRSAQPHSMSFYMAHLVNSGDPSDREWQKSGGDGPLVDAPLRFDCGCVTVEADSSRVRYYLDTCGHAHYKLVA
jgi:hypothetical protein